MSRHEVQHATPPIPTPGYRPRRRSRWPRPPARSQDRQDPLERHLNGVPLDFREIPLSRGLEYIATFADSDFLLSGAEVETIEGKEPLVTAHIDGDKTIRDALIELTANVPEYAFEAVSPHVVNVFLASAKGNPDDLLNLKAAPARLQGVVVTNSSGIPTASFRN